MKILIIEDETIVAEDLAQTLRQVRPGIEIVQILGSVSEAVEYLSGNPPLDLIMSDIQLGDGLSFEISKNVAINVPVIFCTAFDDYALEAFKANGIEYILKPFSIDSLKQALDKFESLQKAMTGTINRQHEAAMAALTSYKEQPNDTLLVKYRDRILPFSMNKIALFYLDNELSHLVTHTGKTYIIPENLEELEKKTGKNFFRMNRQFLVNRNAIKDAEELFPRKLKINLTLPFSKEIVVSKEKKARMLEWMQSRLG